MSPPTDILRPETGIPLQAFTDRHGLGPYVEAANRIASQCFDLEGPVAARKVEDPESGDEWIELRVRARGAVCAVRNSHAAYTRQWLNVVPGDKALKVRVAVRVV